MVAHRSKTLASSAKIELIEGAGMRGSGNASASYTVGSAIPSAYTASSAAISAKNAPGIQRCTRLSAPRKAQPAGIKSTVNSTWAQAAVNVAKVGTSFGDRKSD